jgi:hypothetical protein
MSNYAALADEIERARNDHLNAFGGSPLDVAKKRAALEQLLRNDVFTIIEALRLAATSPS